LTYFAIDCLPGTEPEKLAKVLSEWPAVEKAYVEAGPAPPPQLVNAANDPRSANQGYLDAAPAGIDVEFAWTNGGTGTLGANGAGIHFVDLEQGWMLDHEDLKSAGITLISGVNFDFTWPDGTSTRRHGTSVLGEVLAVDNTIGGVGIAPAATGRVISTWRTITNNNRSDAILDALLNLNFGDVLLLEAQVKIGATYYPIEVEDANFDMIRLGTALGVAIVEAAGNGSSDLDTYTNSAGNQILNRGSADFRDSGAIMVGAANSGIHERSNFSNFGSRVDCYGWGVFVDTCDCDASGTVSKYTANFGGTSSASPIIAGAALVVQGMAQANLGYRFSPGQIRSMLSDPALSTASYNPASNRIGRMPDLKSIIQGGVLNQTPDVYIRDFVGDVGDPHTRAISASPDVILLPSKVAESQVSFGQGSNQENNNMLGYEAKTGQDNFIYVRVLNRGGAAAANVVASVFWSPVSTLVTPDLWTLVGTVTIPNVPSPNVLTVSKAITWSQAAIPGPGHYCLVCLVGNEDDPAPPTSDFLDFDKYRRFIRENNNVTWRNFNVVPNVPSPPSAGYPKEIIVLPFLAPGAPDIGRVMGLETVAHLAKGARVWVELPLYMLDTMNIWSQNMRIDKKREVAWVPTNPHGRRVLGEAFFTAKSRAELKLLIEIPKQARKFEGEVFVRQTFEGEEVGRVTWHLAPLEPK
jgi:serine protease